MNSYLLLRKIHRYLVLVVIVSSIFMMVTGLILKYPKIADTIKVNLVLIRNLHNTASPLFGIVLLLMLFSGSFMYFYPILRKKPNV